MCHVDVAATCHPHSCGYPWWPYFWKPQSMAEPYTGRARLNIHHLFHRNFKWSKDMEEEQRLELISLAIRRLLEENKNKKSSNRSSVDDGDENGNHTLLRDLLSQVRQIHGLDFRNTELKHSKSLSLRLL